jgi:subtilisin-like proprotein convertase family protein
MARLTLQKLFRSMAFKPKNIRRKLHHSTLFLETFEERVVPALPPPSVILESTQLSEEPFQQQFPSAANNETTINYINPQTVADPVNPAYQVMVATSVTQSPNVNSGATSFGVVADASIDNGLIWVPITNFGTANGATEPFDPTVTPTATFPTGVPYTNESSASVAFGRNGEVYFTYLVENAAQTSGAVVFEKGTFNATGLGSLGTFVTGLPTNPGTASSTASSAILYQWTGVDPAENPVIAVDNNVPTYTDPTTGKTITDTMDSAAGLSKGVYVAWNGDSSATPDDITATSFDNSPILAVVSANDGKAGTWSNPSPVNNEGYFEGSTSLAGAPQISFSPGSSGAPGSLIFVWPQIVPNDGGELTTLQTDASQPNNGVAADVIPQAYTAEKTFGQGAAGNIPDAIDNPNSPPTYIPGVKTVTFAVTAANSGLPTSGTPAFSLQDLSIGLSVVDPNLNELSIQLTAPNGKSVFLLNNQTDDNGATIGTQPGEPFAPGLSPPPPLTTTGTAGLGVENGVFSQTIFDDLAARDIDDPTTQFPYIGTYRADGGFGAVNILTQLGLANATAAQLEGTWKLTLTDNVDDTTTTYTPIQYIQDWSLTFSTVKKNQDFGTDTEVPVPTDPATGNPIFGASYSPTLNSPLNGLLVSALEGTPVSPSLAFDTSLGSNSPYAGHFYIAYTGAVLNAAGTAIVDTNIYLAVGTVAAGDAITWNTPVQVNDDSAADNFTEGNRPQLIPAVAVDSSTGTVVLTWYDTRLDASAVRAAEFIATSTDGGQTFSSQTFSTETEQPFLNEPVAGTDIITGTTYDLQPIPTNLVQASGATSYEGVGIRQSVIVHDGIINADWSGNFNQTGASIFGGEAVIAAGSRTVSGDEGDVTGPSTAGGFDSLGDQLGFTVATALKIVASPTGATETGHTVTITTTTAGPALFEVGQTVTIAGVGVTKYNGTFKITGVLSATQFTYTDTTAGLAASGGGTVTSAAGQLFQEEYNTHMGSDGTQGIDGLLVTMDRLINPTQFIGLTSAQLSAIFNIEYRSPYSSLSSPSTQVMVSSVEVFLPADTNETDILVHFVTPQYAVGTYSYSVGPNVLDQVQTLQSQFYSPNTPLLVPSPTTALTVTVPPTYDQTGVVSSLSVPALPAGTPALTAVEVTVNMVETSDSNAKLVLIGPDGTRVVLMNFGDATGEDFIGTTFANTATGTIAAGTAPYNGTFKPASSLAAFAGKQASGTWSLQVVENGDGDEVILTEWSLQLVTASGVLTVNYLGNDMDQSSKGMPDQGAPISGGNPFAVESAVFSMPTATSGTPFTLPYVENTLPLIIAGPHVSNFYAVSTTVVTTGSVASGIPGTIDITLNQPFNAATLAANGSDILSLIDPNGNEVFGNVTLAPFSVSPLVSNTLLPITSGATDILQITLPLDLATGQVYTALTGSYTIDLAQSVVPADYETVGSAVSTTEISFDREMNWPTSPNYNAADPVFSPSNIVSITGPAGVIYDRATATSDPLTVSLATPGDYRDFIIGFPGQILSGTYSIVIDPEFAAATLVAGQEELIDTNENAGLDVLRGTATASTGTAVSNTYSASFSGSTATIPAQVGTIPGSASFPIAITDDYPITISAGHQIEVQLNISSTAAESQHVVNLTADLISPSGTVLQLFTDVGNPLRTPGTLWFSNTVLEDSANTPIQEGFQPFDSGPYNPQFSLDNAFNGETVNGTWTLRITNDGNQTPNLTSWSLILPEITPGSGMGETYADQISHTFTVFTQNPTNTLSQDVWTNVGPQPQTDATGTNIAQTNAIAIDPSDPSGNTVYIGAATGGVWKTTDYLTTNPLGPTWIPLTDNGLINGLNIVSIAVFPRNGNPEQSIIYALTGDGNLANSKPFGEVGSSGVGVLMSDNGGQSWVLLDSTNNEDAAGNVSPFTATTRDHIFDGTEGYKIVVDPTPVNDANHDVIVYMATSIGLYRSVDSGLIWTLMQGGVATDVVLAAGSASTTQTSTGNLQILYAAFEGQGVYMADPAYAASSLVPLTGSPAGNGDFLDTDFTTPTVVKIGSPISTPTGTNGRIVLATPTLTNNPLKDLNYEGWLYALVVSGTGTLSGLYMTKDFGQNWTDVLIPQYITGGDGFGTDDYTLGNDNPFSAGSPEPAGGNYDVSIAIDPTNPNVVYIGGSMTTSIGEGGAGTGGFIRVDTTGLLDAGAIVAYNNAANDGGTTILETDGKPGNLELGITGTTSPVTMLPLGAGEPYGLVGDEFSTGGLLNVLRNPTAPFVSNSVLQFTNIAIIENVGTGSHWEVLDPEILTNVHAITTFVDPLTGETRLLVGDDAGVSSVLIDASGNIVTQIGSENQAVELPSLNRNGDLGSAQMVSTTAQPSQLAAEIAGALLFGISRNNGFPISSAEILQTGAGADGDPELTWSGANATPNTTVPANGQWVIADPGGSGTVYEYEWPCCAGDGDPAADFFRVILPGTGPDGLGRTLFLVQPEDNPGTGEGDWPEGSWLMPVVAGGVPAVNPIDAQGLLLSAPQTGLVFRSTDEGQTWFVVGGDTLLNTSQLDGSYAQALAFGAPNPANPAQLDNFLYAGTEDGNIFVSTQGGGTSWFEVSNGLDGSAVQQIIPDPVRGSTDAYAVTLKGVYYNPNTVAGDAWVNVTGNLFSLKESIFGQTNTTTGSGGEFNALQSINTLAVDWTYAIPVDQAEVGLAKAPILYVGGEGGVFRSLNGGETWAPYPAGTTYSYTDPTTGKQDTISIPAGGYLPTVDVTQLTLSQGNINPTTGDPLQQTGGLNLLTAATFGRGTWVIRLGTPENDPAIAAVAQYQVVQQPGPQVIGVSVITQPQDIGLSALSEVNNTVTATTTGAFNVAVGDQVTISGVTPSGYDGTFSIASVATVGTTVQFTFSDPVTGLAAATQFGMATVGSIDVEFNAPVLASTFTTGQIQITDSNGNPFTITSVTPIVNDVAPQGYPAVPGSPADYHNLFQVNFVPSSTMIASGIGAGFGQVIVGMLISSSITTGYTLSTPEVQTITNNATSGTFTLTFNGQTTPPLAFNATAAQIETALENLTSVGVGNVAVSSASTSTGIVYTVTFPDTGTLSVSSQPLISVTEPEISDYAGFGMDQDGTLLNGETITDPNNGNAAIDAYHGYLILNSAGTAGNLSISMPTVTTAGDPVKVIISDLDPTTGLPVTTYTGTVKITTSDPLVPTITYTFTAADAGTHVFTITFETASAPPNQTLLSVMDTTGTPNPAQAYITVIASYATHLTVTGYPNPDVAGTVGTYTVTALDAYGNIAPSYNGTITMSSTDPLAVFTPTTYTFTSGTGAGFDNGVHVFTNGAELETAGLQTITVTDATNPNGILTGSETVLVVPATPTTIDVTGFPMSIVAGTPGTYTVALFDPYGNLATNYTGTITLSSTDPQASFVPSTYTFTSGSGSGFDNGMHTFTNGATLYTAGTQSITATDTTLAISGSENGIIVNPAATSQLLLNFPNPVTAGTTQILMITAEDQYGNTTPAYTGTITITSSDPQATFIPTTYTFTATDNGVHTFSGTLKTAGTQSITATDTVNSSITGTETGIIVNPAAASTVIVTGFPTPDVAGVAHTYTVTLKDPYGNVATGYRGTVKLSTTDPQGVLVPTTYTFTAGDAGIHTFTATLETAGTWSITAKDSADALTGSESGILVNPAAASTAVVTGFPSPDTAGVVHTYTVTLKDPYGNVATGYRGTLAFTSSDPQATFTTPVYTFTAADDGSHTFTNGATLKTAGTQSITATDTVTSSITGSETGIIVNAATASTVIVSGFPTSDIAGVSHSYTVTLDDPYGNVATGYRGTVTLSSTDPQASLIPTTYTFLTGDAGTHTFTNGATLKTAGTWSITAKDTADSLTGSETGIVVSPAATSQFLITFPTPVTAGTTHSFTVTASDPYGNTTPTYTGTITLTSSDPQASFVPTTYTFSPSDDGVHTFSGTLDTAGTQSITATDTITSTITGTETGITVNPASAATLIVSGFPSPDTAGVVHTFTVTAEDQFGNVATGYLGTITLTSTDPQASFTPTTYTFTAADAGIHTFTNGATLKTAGTQSITATDISNSSITGTEGGILVNPAAASTVIVSGFPTTDTAGMAHTFTITLDDPYGNVATGYLGTITLTSTDPQASFIPSSYMFTASDAGTHTFTNGATLKTAGTQSITATDTVNSTITGSENGIVVSPAATSEFVITYPKLVAVTSTHSFTVSASDPYGNNTPGYTGTVTLTSSDPLAVFVPTTYTFGASDNGIHTFNGTLNTPGTQSITATDTVNSSVTGTETGIVVTPPVTQFLVSYPTTVTAGTLHSFTVTAEDSHGNPVPTYTGTITLTSSDPLASFIPTTYTFLSTDNGVHTFSGTLDTAGMQTVTATDTTDSARTGSDSNILVKAAAATTLSVTGFPNPDVAGVAHSLTVTLRDQFGNVATGYLGSVTLSSTDPQAAFATMSYTFTAADAGSHTFTNGVTLKTAGTWAISARDTSNSSLTSTESGIVVNAAAASTVTLSGYPTIEVAGVSHSFTVTLRDAYGNLATGYVGTVVFTSSDPNAVFSQTPYTFTAADAGSRQFSASLQNLGSQSLTVTDTSNPSLTGTESGIVVSPAPVVGFTLTGEPTLAAGGTAFPITVTAVDQFGHTVPSFSGIVTFTSSDPYANLPASLTLADGVGTASVTLNTPAVRSITATDTSNSSLTGTVNVSLLGGQFQPATVSNEYAAGAGTGPDVTLYNASGTALQTLTPFGPNYTDGVRVAVADFTLSGHPEIAVGTGPGVTAEVKVIDPTTGTVLFDIQPFGTFTGGVFVSEGDIKGDGYADLIITPDQGGGPRVEIYHGGDFAEMANFYGINDPGFRGGARASAGDLTGDGYDDLVVSAGFSGGPRISIYDGKSLASGQTVNLVNDFYAFSSELRNGAYVAVGAVSGGNQADLIFGAGPGGGPEVEIISAQALFTEGAVDAIANPIENYYTGLPANRGGARVAVKNLSGNGFADVVVGDGDLAGSSVRVYQGSTLSSGGIQTEYSFDAYPTLNAGVFVG